MYERREEKVRAAISSKSLRRSFGDPTKKKKKQVGGECSA